MIDIEAFSDQLAAVAFNELPDVIAVGPPDDGTGFLLTVRDGSRIRDLLVTVEPVTNDNEPVPEGAP